MNKSRNSLEEDKIDEELRSILKHFATTVIPTRSKIKEAAAVLNLAESSVEHMRIYGKGSVVSWLKLVMYKYQLSAEQIQQFVDNYRVLATNFEELNDADRMYQEAKARFTEDELYAWLRLLIAKYEIEKELKLRKKKK